MELFLDGLRTPQELVQSLPGDFRTKSLELQSLQTYHESSGSDSDKSSIFQTENPKYPSELQKTLLDFIIAYMMEDPKDMIDYAVSHFTKLQKKRNTANIRAHLEKQLLTDPSSTSSSSLQEKKMDSDSFRRSSVFSETFDTVAHPEDDDDDDRIIIPKTDKQRERLLEALKNNIIFNSLQLEKMYQLVDALFEKNVAAGDVIIREGEEGDNFYIIENGAYDVYAGGGHINTLTKGTFGEMALLYNVVRAATVQAVCHGKLWVMNRQTFRKILHTQEMQKQERYKTLMKNIPIFQVLNKYEKTKIIEAFETKFFKKGQLIVKQGDDPVGVYFIESGVAAIYADHDDNKGEVLLAKFTKSHYFGHLAVLAKRKCLESIYADTDLSCVFLDANNFKFYMKKCFVGMIKAIYEDFGVSLDDIVLNRLNLLQTKTERELIDE